MLMIAAFMSCKKYQVKDVTRHSSILSLYHNTDILRYLINAFSEAFVLCLYLSAFTNIREFHMESFSDIYAYYNHMLTFYVFLPFYLLKQVINIVELTHTSRYLISHGRNAQFPD